MHSSPRNWRVVALALAVTLGLAVPAGAHPFVRGGEAPVDSLTTVELAMAHGCGTEDSGGGDPTLEVAMEVPAEMRLVEVAEHPDYDHQLEVDDDGRIEVIAWTAIGDGEPAPEFGFDAVLTGEVGEEVYLRVFQGCDGFAYRWIGTPDDPADDPAVRITLVAADPDAPAPDEEELTPAEAEAAPAAGDDQAGEEETDPSDDLTDDTTADDPADDPGDEELDPADAEAEDRRGFPVLPVVVVALVLIGLGFVLARRMGRGAPADGSGGDGTQTGA